MEAFIYVRMVKKKKGRLQRGVGAIADPNNALLTLDPSLIRYQHSKIRPYFSGCGRSVQSTYDQIVAGDLEFNELPAIEIINPNSIPATADGTYFSLNNRRLWVAKELRSNGHLETVNVRTRGCKSEKEAKRYTVENCSLKAKFVRERDPNEAFSVAEIGVKECEMDVADAADDKEQEATSTDETADEVKQLE